MKIARIDVYQSAVPLKKAFKTALRTVTMAESIVVKVTTDDGLIGWGEAPPTHVITGDSLASIRYAVKAVIEPAIVGMSVLERDVLFGKLQQCLIGNTSAKAAVDMALHDCIAQHAGLPLYQFLGGVRDTLETDYTVSVNSPEEMASDAAGYVKTGFQTLKIKVGKDDIDKDMKRLQAVREAVGSNITLRLDANQGWDAKTAVRAISRMEDLGLDIELVEQPVAAADVKGLQYVTNHVQTPIMADESLFSPQDALRLLEMRAADLLNIKLMKAGGIQPALDIARIAKVYGVECMVGCMIESRIGISAAAHLAASQMHITRVDFDAPLMLREDIVTGGVRYEGCRLLLNESPGLGILAVDALGELVI
ncbi:dipeptide epimerase [Terribacillus sp. 179-K 1B1 HS]|uniref:mandelate racemase/muconate lactonizing enzyme family protein n=1 Tax=Terribacillus sp. 179-K 1B1 HS TaxID=3142388 RepID=UPI0039A1BBC4